MNYRHSKKETQKVLEFGSGKATWAVFVHEAHSGFNMSFISNRYEPFAALVIRLAPIAPATRLVPGASGSSDPSRITV